MEVVVRASTLLQLASRLVMLGMFPRTVCAIDMKSRPPRLRHTHNIPYFTREEKKVYPIYYIEYEIGTK
jgi:hypothetical protein